MNGGTDAFVLDDDRFFDPDPVVREIARYLYNSVRDLPLICPHGHVDPAILSSNEPFPDPVALLITPDHYILRMLYSQGVPLESLGIEATDAREVESDPKRIWQRFADCYYLFRGTPTKAWLDYQLAEVFQVTRPLDGSTAGQVYGEICERLSSPEFRPRALFDLFNIEVLATTDKAADPLDHHQAIRKSEWGGRVIPTFRPDSLFAISAAGWMDELEALSAAADVAVTDAKSFLEAIAVRRSFFRSMGATATDHGVDSAYTERLASPDLEVVFERALDKSATVADQVRFEAHMLMEMAEMSLHDGLVMQIHPGVLRNHNSGFSERFGPDKGCDIPVVHEYTRNLRPLLTEYGNNADFTLVLFTLDESTYSRELAPLAGHYPAVRLGPPWWFNDSIEGMRRFREHTTETAGIYNTAGFNDDTRAFCSIPARHDLSRRMDSNFLARLVATHVIPKADALEMAHSLAYGLAKSTYKLDAGAKA